MSNKRVIVEDSDEDPRTEEEEVLTIEGNEVEEENEDLTVEELAPQKRIVNPQKKSKLSTIIGSPRKAKEHKKKVPPKKTPTKKNPPKKTKAQKDTTNSNVPKKTVNKQLRATSTEDFLLVEAVHKNASFDWSVHIQRLHKLHAFVQLDHDNPKHQSSLKYRYDKLFDNRDSSDFPRVLGIKEPLEVKINNWDEMKVMLNEIAERDSVLTTATIDKYENLIDDLKQTEQMQKELAKKQNEKVNKTATTVHENYLLQCEERKKLQEVILKQNEELTTKLTTMMDGFQKYIDYKINQPKQMDFQPNQFQMWLNQMNQNFNLQRLAPNNPQMNFPENLDYNNFQSQSNF